MNAPFWVFMYILTDEKTLEWHGSGPNNLQNFVKLQQHPTRQNSLKFAHLYQTSDEPEKPWH